MGRSWDLEAGGTRFDSWLAQVTLGSLWAGRGHFFVNFGKSWDVSGSGLGMFLDRFGMVLENMSNEVDKNKVFRFVREYFS